MKVKSEREVTQSCPTLSDPMDCSLAGSSIHGIFEARVLEWGATAFSSILPSFGIKRQVLSHSLYSFSKKYLSFYYAGGTRVDVDTILDLFPALGGLPV